MLHLFLWVVLLYTQTAEAVKWPEINAPVYEDTVGKKDRAVIISIEEYQFLEGVSNASQNADDWEVFFFTNTWFAQL